MGKKVTYGIKYTRIAKIPEILEEHFQKFKSLSAKGRQIEAAQLVLGITEWLLDEIEESEDPEDPEFLQHLPKTIKYSEAAIKFLEERDDTELLPRAHDNICQCYFKMHLYELAVEHGLKTVSIFKNDNSVANKHNLQCAYKVLGDIYFTKSLNTAQSRFKDYLQARKFYKLEREVIDTMVLEDIPDPKKGDLERLKQSSHFNMGVIESKIPALYKRGEQNLRLAVSLAHSLNDYTSERTSWWELGNLYKRIQQYNNVKLCLNRELAITKAHDLPDDYFYCFEENIKLHLFLEEYNQCFELYKETVSSIQPAYTQKCKQLLDMVEQVKYSWDCVQKMIDDEEETVPTIILFLEYIQLLSDYDLNQIIVKKIDTELGSIVRGGSNPSLIYARILLHKARALWSLKESKKDTYLVACTEAYNFISASLSNHIIDRLTFAVEILKIRVKVLDYFGDIDERDSCKKMLSQYMKEERLEKQQLAHHNKLRLPDKARITPDTVEERKAMIIHVVIMTFPKAYEMELQYDELPETVVSFMKEVSERCWVNFGIEPIISHITISGQDVFPKDLLREYIKDKTNHVKVSVKGIVEKTAEQLYRNASFRLDVNRNLRVLRRLQNQTLTEMKLNSQNIVATRIELIQQILEHTNSLKLVDLSVNFLNDGKFNFLFGKAFQGLSELRLSNNQLTAASLDTIITLSNLKILDLSYNEIGPAILQRLPNLFDHLPHLKNVNLEGTRLGAYCDIDSMTKDAYTSYGTNYAAVRANVSLDISNNHFEGDLLWHWTTLWTNLKCITSLTLSNITSDTGWDNFHSLSDLPSLSDLIFAFSTKETLSICDFGKFFSSRPNFGHLDFTCCDLIAYDIQMLANSIEQHEFKLKKLTLNSNPKIGDEGIYFLNRVITQSRLQILHVSRCGLTTNCLVAPWTFILDEIDLTENAVHDDGFIDRLNKSTFIKVDDYKNLLTEGDEPTESGLSYKYMDTLPNNPFTL